MRVLEHATGCNPTVGCQCGAEPALQRFAPRRNNAGEFTGMVTDRRGDYVRYEDVLQMLADMQQSGRFVARACAETDRLADDRTTYEVRIDGDYAGEYYATVAEVAALALRYSNAGHRAEFTPVERLMLAEHRPEQYLEGV